MSSPFPANPSFLSCCRSPTHRTALLTSRVRVLPLVGSAGVSLPLRKSVFSVSCSGVGGPPTHLAGNGDGRKDLWTSWILRGVGAPEQILRLISRASASAIGQFVDSPRTFLHSLDPRIKLVWLLSLVLIPARSHIYVRLGLILYLSFLSVWVLPKEIWMEQLGRVAMVSGILFIMLGFGTDGVPPLVQSRVPSTSMIGLPNIPSSLEGHSYVIMKLGPLQLTRKGLSVAMTSACLSFSTFQSVTLCLTTTTAEQLVSALRWFMAPLIPFGVPVAEIVLTLLLSLRFINVVFDEVRNAALGIVARRIVWRQLSLMETLDVFVTYVRRIFKNIFFHAEQISTAMIARGFRGDCNKHKLYIVSENNNKLSIPDISSLFFLACVVGLAFFSEKILH